MILSTFFLKATVHSCYDRTSIDRRILKDDHFADDDTWIYKSMSNLLKSPANL